MYNRGYRQNNHQIGKSHRGQENSVSQRCVYITQQYAKKQKSTIFHSPYKDGKKNMDYINPSFISNNLFYPHIDTFQLKRGLNKNVNDISQQQLRNQRFKRSISAKVLIPPKNQPKSKRKQQREHKRVFGQKSRLVKLQNQYNKLVLFNEEIIHNNSHQGSNTPKLTQIPSYFNIKRIQKQQQAIEKRNYDMREWMRINKQIQKVKQSRKKEQNQRQNMKVTHAIERQKERNILTDLKNKENANLLSKILKQQIKYKQIQKLKDRQYSIRSISRKI